MSRTPFIPYRAEEVVALGRATRLIYGGTPIEEVASSESIVLEFVSYNTIKRAGISVLQPMETSNLFLSNSEPGLLIESRSPAVRSLLKFIAVAIDHKRGTEDIPIDEIFWHEYFHINWSPGLMPYDPTLHEYSTHGVLDRRDESNADLFTAAVLIDAVTHDDSLYSISRRNSVSSHLSQIALDIERSHRLFSRDWTPRYG